MNISIDENGNVSLDNTYTTGGIDTIEGKMSQILSTMKTFDETQIQSVVDKLNSLYPDMVNFDQFFTEWLSVLGEVEL
jgi:hypothetical protein